MIEELEKLDDLTAYNGKWKNLWFLYSGESFLAQSTYETQKEALSRSRLWLANMMEYRYLSEVDTAELGRIALGAEVSHCIQVPVGHK